MAASIKNVSDLFEHELKDIYDAEKKLVDALAKLASETTDPEVKKAYQDHREETIGHAVRLEKVFGMLHKEASRGEGCAGITGLLEEKKEFAHKEPSREILQIFNLGAAMKTERYEITAYEGLINLADMLQLDEAVTLLQKNLEEEEAALDKLLAFADETPRVSGLAANKEKNVPANRSRRN